MNLSFDNTEIAFAYKTDKDLKKARFLFSSMAKSWLVKLGTKITPLAIKLNLPINGLIKNTIFKQFVGGETLEETKPVIDELARYNVHAILDYGVEGKEGEDSFEHATAAFINVIEYAASQKNIPFISIKLTGFARFGLLEKLDAAANSDSGAEGKIDTGILNDDEKNEFEKVRSRLIAICDVAAKKNVGVLIDAEETFIQDPVDALAMQMMQLFNKEKAIVYNTVQLYRHDRLRFLKKSFQNAGSHNCILAVKLVRGAYMEKERKRAEEMNYPSPIQPDKRATDKDYNAAVEFCISQIDKIFLIVASHNELSNLYATQLLQKQHGVSDHTHVHFSQLYGMSDNITFNLAKAGYSVSKYLPFGPIADVIPYLMRRAEENSSISNYTGRELALIKKELQRRKED
ncbi:MAG: proline dehydrogenase family protein [Ginsengibacter sp.]